jgi:hypothetical protein
LAHEFLFGQVEVLLVTQSRPETVDDLRRPLRPHAVELVLRETEGMEAAAGHLLPDGSRHPRHVSTAVVVEDGDAGIVEQGTSE